MKALHLYAPLIGIPTLALIAVLRTGERLSAPPAVHGIWTLSRAETDASLSARQIDEGGCTTTRDVDSLRRLVITQSGPRADAEIRTAEGVVWARVTLRVRRGVAVGPLRGVSVLPGCSSAGVLSLAFSGSVPGTLHATLDWPGCDSCAALHLAAAVRRKRASD